MKKLALCLILLFVSMPLLAGATGIGIGIGGGIDMIVPDVEDAETETYPEIAGLIDFSLPGIPIGLRGGIEYAWKSEEQEIPIIGTMETKTTVIPILLAGQYNVVLPGAPMSFYVGAGGELAMMSATTTIGDAEEDYSKTAFGFLAYAGANYSMGNMGIFAEVGYGMIFAEEEDADYAWSNFTHIPIRGGIKFNL
jgi:hypothetical protein